MAKRILVRNHGPVTDNVIKAFAAAFAQATANSATTIHLIVPSKAAFSTTVIADALGEKATKELLKGNMVAIKNGVVFKLESADTLRNSTAIRIALAAYLGARDLRAVDSLGGLQSVVFLPWHSDDGEGWQQSWSAEVLGEKCPEAKLNLNADLEEKLKSLTMIINRSTGLSHPSDLKTAKQMFESLVADGVPVEPREVKIWALRNGWRPDHAEDLYDLAIKYN